MVFLFLLCLTKWKLVSSLDLEPNCWKSVGVRSQSLHIIRENSVSSLELSLKLQFLLCVHVLGDAFRDVWAWKGRIWVTTFWRCFSGMLMACEVLLGSDLLSHWVVFCSPSTSDMPERGKTPFHCVCWPKTAPGEGSMYGSPRVSFPSHLHVHCKTPLAYLDFFLEDYHS